MIRGDLTSDVVLADDDVFLKDDKKRAEYVLNEQGVIYRGSSDYIFPLNWDYGQVGTRRGWMDWLHWDGTNGLVRESSASFSLLHSLRTTWLKFV